MIQIEVEFVSGDGGYSAPPGPLTYKQIKRSEKVALYQRFYADGKPKDFEVFIIKVDPKGKIQKFPGGVTKTVEDDTEKYPATGQFGKIAWSLRDLNEANNRFDQLCKQADTPEEEEEESKDLTIPLGEFTIGELAEKNSVNYATAFLFIKDAVEKKTVIFLREERRASKGKPSRIFAKA